MSWPSREGEEEAVEVEAPKKILILMMEMMLQLILVPLMALPVQAPPLLTKLMWES